MAKSLFASLLKHYLFWLLLFAFGRMVFLIWNREELAEIPWGEILFSFVKGLYVDTAMACYLLILPFLLYMLAAYTTKFIFVRISNGIHLVLFIAFFLITFGELPIYDEWHTKLTFKALWFFSHPAEVFHTATWTQILSCFITTAALTAVTFTWYKRKIALRQTETKREWMALITYTLLFPALIFTGMRGGYYTIPIQLSDAYYSQYNILNLASLNSTFNLASSCIENLKVQEPYHLLTDKDCADVFASLNTPAKDSTIHVLTTTRPNVVLVVLEGWSADMIASYGGYDNTAPNMSAISQEGIRFTDCYASGSLSDQGMAAVFSAFPAQPKTSIITQPNKYVKLPCINKVMETAGYHTSFMFGGQLSYGNIRSYMFFNGFDKIIEGKDFDSNIPQGKLGAHDQFLFDRQLKELHNEQQPFFAAMFTLSTHGPYDFPKGSDLNFGDKEKDYVNSVHYADSCIGDFISRAKKEPWYNNTLFVFVSDHSHNTPHNYPFNAPEYRRIPMLFYGAVIDSTYRGMNYEAVASQTDLASTLLHQLDLPSADFKFSKNLFNPSAIRFAYYSFDEGFGFVNGQSTLVWGTDQRADFNVRTNPRDSTFAHNDSLSILKNGQSILQTISVDYWRY